AVIGIGDFRSEPGFRTVVIARQFRADENRLAVAHGPEAGMKVDAAELLRTRRQMLLQDAAEGVVGPGRPGAAEEQTVRTGILTARHGCLEGKRHVLLPVFGNRLIGGCTPLSLS